MSANITINSDFVWSASNLVVLLMVIKSFDIEKVQSRAIPVAYNVLSTGYFGISDVPFTSFFTGRRPEGAP
jgi:hypothetical protein